MRSNYLRDYGGPLVDWPGDDVKPDWAALYPIPASKRIEDRPTKKRRCEELLPVLCCTTLSRRRLQLQTKDSGGYDQPVLDDLPPVVVPYAKGKAWMAAYTQAAMRLVRRLEKGVELRPNCTAEELVLHRLIDMPKISWEEEDEVVAEAIKGLPRSTLDEDFDLVSDAAFQDHDVLMLFDMPQLINTSEMSQMMGCANLHPQDWFKPFKQHLTSNHV